MHVSTDAGLPDSRPGCSPTPGKTAEIGGGCRRSSAIGNRITTFDHGEADPDPHSGAEVRHRAGLPTTEVRHLDRLVTELDHDEVDGDTTAGPHREIGRGGFPAGGRGRDRWRRRRRRWGLRGNEVCTGVRRDSRCGGHEVAARIRRNGRSGGTKSLPGSTGATGAGAAGSLWVLPELDESLESDLEEPDPDSEEPVPDLEEPVPDELESPEELPDELLPEESHPMF